MQSLELEFAEIDIDLIPTAETAMQSINGGIRRIPTIILGDHVLVEPSDNELTEAILEYRKTTV